MSSASARFHRKRNVVLATADPGLRQRLLANLSDIGWNVREANGGAEALAYLEEQIPEVLIVDFWLPDLEVDAFTKEVCELYPKMDLLRIDGTAHQVGESHSSSMELIQVVRKSSGHTVPGQCQMVPSIHLPAQIPGTPDLLMKSQGGAIPNAIFSESKNRTEEETSFDHSLLKGNTNSTATETYGLVGQSPPMRELVHVIRLVAPHAARVLIEGQTGTGKELVAKAVHALSRRAKKPFVVLNCAAVPESLLEAELFGHTRGAFTGAVQSRVGRIEAANGGTLFLDEIGEMPLSLQSKLLRFLENGELQRVGDNEPVRVDVRVIAATHQHLEQRAEQGTFRLDLFHRLAVFPIAVPSLHERLEDIPALAEHFLAQLGSNAPRKRLSREAEEKLSSHSWPGNVRELANVLQRAVILAGDQPLIGPVQIILRHSRPA